MDANAFIESRARRLYPRRWRFLACALAYWGLAFSFFLAAWVGWQSPINPAYLFAFLSPLMVWPWGLLCWATWFHPERGGLRVGSPWLRLAPRVVQDLIRTFYIAGLFLWFLTPFVAVLTVLL